MTSPYETPNKALEAVIVSLGGSKAVAPRLWPEKTVEEARRLLCDCLNDDRPAKLDFAQVLLILRWGKERGIHTGMTYIAAELGYSEPTPIEPRDEMADLLRRYLQRDEELASERARLHRLITAHLGPKAAA